MLKNKKRKKISWKKRIGLFYGVGLFLTILFAHKEINEVSKEREPMANKESIEYINTELETEPEILKINRTTQKIELASADEQDKKIEEYLELLETLEKTQEEYIQMRENLLKVKEELKVSPYEDTLYSEIISIGDAIIPIDDSVPIYATNKDLADGTNYKTSYYGTKEVLLVSEVVMQKNDAIASVDNMEDYELLKSIDFHEIGYKGVDQYSLQEDGSLVEVGKYETEGVLLVFQSEEKEKTRTRTRIPKVDSLLC